MTLPVPTPRGKPNRLLGEKSPYLLQHAYNPVDWQPWGEEAFAQARRENKPIFLSIGYSTCHWCHVMEKESFSNPDTAAVLNRDFVAIKVDREERPDVDKIYMTAVQAMTGQGGWPLSVWLTPQLKPFFGGTYFPPGPQWGRPGFSELLGKIAELWKSEPAKIAASSEQLSQFLRGTAKPAGRRAPPGPEALKKGLAYYRSSFDPEHGGFGGAPKFPMPVHHNFLLRCHGRGEGLRLSAETLRPMAAGGIFDQLGGGFHRYSTDERWHVPHFEKMLYDNAQIAVNYLEAYQLTGEPGFAQTARETLDYVLRDLRHPQGGFYSAEDADSLPPELAGKVSDEGHEHRTEGSFYIWEKKEILSILGERDGALFCLSYGVEDGGNAQEDPHGEFRGKNILWRARSTRDCAEALKIPEAEAEKILSAARSRLFAVRAQRPRPHLDDKILASWNGLMLSALARAAQAFAEPRYLAAAEQAARFLQENLYDAAQPRLYRRWRDGEKKVPGIADDYVFLVQGLLDLYEASFDAAWLDWAAALSDQADALFLDGEQGGYFMTGPDHDPNLLSRSKEDYDNVEPSASSVAALNLLRLAEFTGDSSRRKKAEATLACFAAQMLEHPQSLPQMLVALDFYLAAPRQIVIAGKKDAADTGRLLKEVNSRLLPRKILLLADGGEGQRALARGLDFLKTAGPLDGKAAAYVCENFACQLPLTEPAALGRLLDGGL